MITLGEYSYIGDRVSCFEGTELIVGKFCGIASDLHIVTGQHPPKEHPECVSNYPFKEQMGLDYCPCKMDGKVIIGNDVWIGECVSIMDGVTVGDGAIIGAHSVVTKDVLPYAVVAGNPAVFKKFRFLPLNIERLLQIKWWDWDIEEIKKAIPEMKNIEEFVRSYGES